MLELCKFLDRWIDSTEAVAQNSHIEVTRSLKLVISKLLLIHGHLPLSCLL